jgi:UDP-N-acetylmuramoylalanine--D-glutamate ligase
MIPISRFATRPVAIFGLGLSGMAAARALMAGKADVRAWDDTDAARAQAAAAGIPLADPQSLDWSAVAALVLSPGVPLNFPAPHPVVKLARARGVPVIGDIELLVGCRRPRRVVGVTGTNGKSTTTALIGHVLSQCGRRAEVGGNLGTPALALEPLGSDDIYVLEMSSYQLELSPSWRPEVGVLLNITPDHLDRHGSMAGYVAAKRLMFARQQAGDTAIIGVDDEDCAAIARESGERRGPRVIRLHVGRRRSEGVSVEGGRLYDEGREVGDLRSCATLPGPHNWQNAAAAYGAARALGLGIDPILAAMANFPGLAHRQELVGRVDGVAFVNDSKATNADAAAKALACYENIYWIAGGRAKEGGIAGLAPYWPRIRHAYFIGEAAEDFAAHVAGKVQSSVVRTLEAAVAEAHARARAEGAGGAVVLLSPACASFDQFRNFEHRGEVFRQLVAALAGGRKRAAKGEAA